MELKDRPRKIDLNKIAPEQADVISKQIGEKIREICDKAVNDANRLLNVYGMSAKMQISITHPDLEKSPVVTATPKKRGRPKKAPQSL